MHASTSNDLRLLVYEDVGQGAVAPTQIACPRALRLDGNSSREVRLWVASAHDFPSCHVDSDHEIKTRVTTLEEMKVKRKGDDCLVVIYAPSQSELGKRHVLQKDVTAIGRDRDNDIVLDSDSVSRRHAKLEHRDGDFYVIDLDSTNGTFVNAEPEPVTTLQLRRGDQ